jgi:hypothetical protein
MKAKPGPLMPTKWKRRISRLLTMQLAASLSACSRLLRETLQRHAATRLTICRCCGGELARPGLALVG